MTEITSSDMVKAALDGGHRDNTEGIAFIKKRFGTDMRTQVFGRLKRFLDEQRPPTMPALATGGALVNPTPEVVAQAEPVATQNAVNPMVALAVTLRDLVRDHGPQKVRDTLEVVEALAKD